MMMDSENFPPTSWPIDQFEPYGLDMDVNFTGCELYSSFTGTDDSSDIFSLFSNEIFPFPAACDDQFQVIVPSDVFSVPMEAFESMLTERIEDLHSCLDDSAAEESFSEQPPLLSSQMQDEWSPTPSIRSSEASIDMNASMLSLPGEAMEIDNQLSLFHLLQAHGEATENNQKELAEVILRCVCEKGNPVGETWERIAFNLSQNIQNQADYLIHESSKNFDAAFKAFYQMFPYGRFAHFAANSAILEAAPSDTDILHIVDFDIGEGIQWPPMIEAMAWQHKILRLTSIRWGEEENFGLSPWRFENTRNKLCDHAMTFGLKLKMEEMTIQDLLNELNQINRQGEKKWLAFNCMVGLPHMGKTKTRKLVTEFLTVANQLLTTSGNCNPNRGIITFGDGDPACDKPKDRSSFGSFFQGHLIHYQAVLESMQSNFPTHLVQARMAMESLFVGTNISSQAWFQRWNEINNQSCHFQTENTLEGLRVSRDRLMEAKEIVRERENLYEVSIGGNSGNELALGWRGTTLVRVSFWRN